MPRKTDLASLLRDIDTLAAGELSHGQIGARLGLQRSRVTNLLRLRKLPLEVLNLVLGGQLSATHGVLLLAAPSRAAPELARLAVRRRWSVSRLRWAVGRVNRGVPVAELALGDADAGSADVTALARDLSELIGSPVTLTRDGPRGWRIAIRASDNDVLDGILERLGWRP